MKKKYIAPSVETDLLALSDVITTSEIGVGEFGIKGSDVFGLDQLNI